MTGFQAPWEQDWAAKQALLAQRVATLERQIAQQTSGPIACTSTTHPASPWAGMQIYETDTGLTAIWTGTAWNYPGMQLLAKTVLGSSTASVRLPTSGSLPQVFTNLHVVISAQSSGTGSAGYDSANMQINGVSTASYTWSSWFLTQGAASVNTFGATTATSAQVAEIWNAHFASAGQGIATIEIPDYASASKLKSWTSLSAAIDGGTVSIMQQYAGALDSGATAAVSFLTLAMSAGSFVPGSSFCVYGMD